MASRNLYFFLGSGSFCDETCTKCLCSFFATVNVNICFLIRLINCNRCIYQSSFFFYSCLCIAINHLFIITSSFLEGVVTSIAFLIIPRVLRFVSHSFKREDLYPFTWEDLNLLTDLNWDLILILYF